MYKLKFWSNKDKSKFFHNGKDYSFKSGERQTGRTLNEIREDHKARYRAIATFLKSNGPINASTLGLDCFSGNGYGSYLLSEALNCAVLGIDGSPDAAKFAGEHFSTSKTFFAQKFFPFKLPEGNFDFVCCIESIEHIENPVLLLETISASIKRDGYLFISFPNETLLPLACSNNPFHFRHFTMDEIDSMILDSTDFVLETWYGQDVYEMSGGVIMGTLDESLMGLKERSEGQFLIAIYRKTTLETC